MNRWGKRVLFYGGTLAFVVLMCQDFVRRAHIAVLGDSAGESLYSFVRTNVEAPISIIFIALYLDLVLGRRHASDVAAGDGPATDPAPAVEVDA